MRAYVVSGRTAEPPPPPLARSFGLGRRHQRQPPSDRSAGTRRNPRALFVRGAALEHHGTHMGLCNLHEAASAFGLISIIYAHKVMIERAGQGLWGYIMAL